MYRNSLKIRKSLGKVQKQNLPETLNNAQKDNSLTTLPNIHLPSNTLNLRQDPLRKNNKKLCIDGTQKTRSSRSTQHLPTKVSSRRTPKPSLHEINQLENINLIKQYSSVQIQHFLKKDSSSSFLDRHEVKGYMRAKMVDWMIEVLSSYKCSEKTFFQAVELMDNYFRKTQRIQSTKNLHLVGVCCMFIIIKLEEVVPIRLKTVYQKIGHKKLSLEMIKNKEQQVFSAVNYNVIIPTLYDVITTSLHMWNIKGRVTSKTLQQILQFSLHMGKTACIEYELVSCFSKAVLSGACIFLGFKILKQINSKFEADRLEILKILGVEYEEVSECSNKVLELAKNFQRFYPELESLKRFSKLSESKNNIL